MQGIAEAARNLVAATGANVASMEAKMNIVPVKKDESSAPGAGAGAVKTRDLYLYIDSANRDHKQWPVSGQFEHVLSAPLKNIVSLGVIQGKFPLCDPAVHEGNQKLRFALVGVPLIIHEAVIPPGCYRPTTLALEITTQMNMLLFEAELLAATHHVDYSNGFVYNNVGPTLETNNVRVSFSEPAQSFSFQVIDATETPIAAPTLRLYANKLEPGSGPYYTQIDDIWDVLGFDREEFIDVGTFEPAINCFYIANDVTYDTFGGGANLVDLRLHYALHSDKAASTHGADYVTLSIQHLDDADIIHPSVDVLQRAPVPASFLGRIILKDAAVSSEKTIDFTNGSFPIVKKYVSQSPTVNRMHVRVYRPDGSIADFGGRDWFIVFRVTVEITPRDDYFLAVDHV